MRAWRLMLAILLGAVALLGAVYTGAAALVYENVSRVPPDCGGGWEGNAPDGWAPPSWATEFDASAYFTDFETYTIPSRDEGIDLHAWWLPPDDPAAPAVIVIHGRATCIRHPEVLAPAGMLHRLGFGALLIDLRDHGSSTIEDGRYAGGTEEYRDVIGAVDWLVERGVLPGSIGVLGTSLGAATAIIAGGEDDRIGAVWEDSSYADQEQRVAEDLEQRGFPAIVATALAPATKLIARIVSGDDLASHTVTNEVREISGHLFITHGAKDESTFVHHAYQLLDAARAAGVETDSWIVPDAGHVHALFLHPDAYEAHLGEFFGSALLPAPPAAG